MIVKPQFYYSLNPSATQITYCRRHSYIIDVTFIPHFQRQSLTKKKIAFLSLKYAESLPGIFIQTIGQ